MKVDLAVEQDESVSLNKIYTYLNDPTRNKPAVGNGMMMYEPKYWDHGAISAKDKLDRRGKYLCDQLAERWATWGFHSSARLSAGDDPREGDDTDSRVQKL